MAGGFQTSSLVFKSGSYLSAFIDWCFGLVEVGGHSGLNIAFAGKDGRSNGSSVEFKVDES